MKKSIIIILGILAILGTYLLVHFFSEENQNKLNRSISNTFGHAKGCVKVFVGQPHPVQQWLNVEKLSTAYGTSENNSRSYRYGSGFIDENLNNKVDPEEQKIGKQYFEISEFSQYVYSYCD